MNYTLNILDTAQELNEVEELQRKVWPGSETDVVPGHVLRACVHSGGLVVGAYTLNQVGSEPGPGTRPTRELVGFVFGFPGFYTTPDGPRLKHCSHMLGVHPEHRNRGLGYLLKRAQWQMVRHQGIDRITWTYDPLLTPNAHLNIARLGAVCNTYLVDFYGPMRDGLNAGLPSDRFMVDWWVNTRRVYRRLSKRARLQLDFNQYLAANALIVTPSITHRDGWRQPPGDEISIPASPEALLLVEIPLDFNELKRHAPGLALEWRLHIRSLFQKAFASGYLVTDFVHQNLAGSDSPESCYYVLSHGESTL